MIQPGQPPSASPASPRTLVLGCGALARELLELVAKNGLSGSVDVRCLPASLHNRPQEIAPAVEAKLVELAPSYEHVFVAYADCGSAGALDRVLDAYGVERLPGAHCYAAYAGLDAFDALAAEEPGTFYLTDFLARSFDALIVKGLGLDRYPHLLPVYFAGYQRLVYLSQREDPELLAHAQRAAERLGLAFEHHPTGYGEIGTAMARLRAEMGDGPATLPAGAEPAAEADAATVAEADAGARAATTRSAHGAAA